MPTFPSISGVIADFSQADGTTLESLTNWVKYAGSNTSIITATGQGKLSAGTYAEYGYEVTAGPNCEGYFTVPAKANGVQVGGAWHAFLMGVHPGSTSTDRFGYQVECDTNTSGNPLIFIGKKTQPSTTTSVASTTATAMSVGDKIGWRATVTGTTATLIEVFLFSSGSWNQTPILTYNDTTSPYTTAGAMAFGMGDSSTFPLRVDDIGFGTTVSSQGGPASSTVRFATTTTGRKTGKATAAATVKLAGTVAGAATLRGGPAASSLKLAGAVAGFKTGLSSHDEASPLPPFTQQVAGTLDLVRFATTVTGAQTHTGPSATTVKLTSAVTGRKTALAPAAATVTLTPAATWKKTATATTSTTAKLVATVAGRKTASAAVAATVRFTITAAGTQREQHSGASSTLVRFLVTAAGVQRLPRRPNDGGTSAPHQRTGRVAPR